MLTLIISLLVSFPTLTSPSTATPIPSSYSRHFLSLIPYLLSADRQQNSTLSISLMSSLLQLYKTLSETQSTNSTNPNSTNHPQLKLQITNLLTITTAIKSLLSEPTRITVKGQRNINIGDKNLINGNNNIVKGNRSVLIGNNSQVFGNDVKMMGVNSRATGDGHFIVGKKVNVSGEGNVVFANLRDVSGKRQLVVERFWVDLKAMEEGKGVEGYLRVYSADDPSL